MEHPYTQTTPSGVVVHSSVPFVPPRWWDRPSLHFVWSYLSWATMILAARNIKQPRTLFRKYLSR